MDLPNIPNMTSHHSVRQASLKEIYTSFTNMWTHGMYNWSLRTVIRLLLRAHLAPARMARYCNIQQQRAKRKQARKMQQNQKHQSKSLKSRMSFLMDEFGIAIINQRPAAVIQKIGQKLQQLLQPSLVDMCMDNEQSGQNTTAYSLCSLDSHAEEKDDEMEEEEEEDDDADDDEQEKEKSQESSAKSIRALLAIVRMLVESAKISRIVTSEDIQHGTFKGTTFTEREKEVAAKIVNFLRPFVPQRTEDNQLPKPHVLLSFAKKSGIADLPL